MFSCLCRIPRSLLVRCDIELITYINSIHILDLFSIYCCLEVYMILYPPPTHTHTHKSEQRLKEEAEEKNRIERKEKQKKEELERGKKVELVNVEISNFCLLIV